MQTPFRKAAVIVALTLSIFIVVDILSSWFGVFSEKSQSAKFSLFVLAMCLCGFSLIDLFEVWTEKLTFPAVLLAAATTLAVSFAANTGTDAVRDTIRRQETRSTEAGDQMRATEKSLGIGN